MCKHSTQGNCENCKIDYWVSFYLSIYKQGKQIDELTENFNSFSISNEKDIDETDIDMQE